MSETLLTITSAENAVELTLTDAAVIMKLSESVLNQVESELQQSMQHDEDVQKGNLAGRFGQFVAQKVEGLLHRSIEYPIADITAVAYQDGKLAFTYKKKHLLSFESVSVDKTPALASFAEKDAQNFVQMFGEVKQRQR